MEVKIYPSRLEVARQFSDFLADTVDSADEVHIALSGGSTPKVIFEELTTHYRERISWSRVHFYWGDERCVPPGHHESNFGMCREHLLNHIDIPETNIHRIRGESDPQKEAERYAALLKDSLPSKYRVPQFDLVILGLGEDGHTASIFPHEMQLWDSRNYCEVAHHPTSGQQRITVTGKIINNAAVVAFLVTGAAKAEKVREILQQQGSYETYPASRVSPRSGKLLWYLDKESAGGII